MAGLDPEVGTVIGGRFVLEKRVGTGGFGSVWRASDRAGRGAVVALKLLHDHHHFDERIRSRFEQEAKVLSTLDHPSIAKCLAWDINDDVGYLALEYVDAITLARGMVRHVKKDTPFKIKEVRRIFSELAAAIQFAHQHDIIHRDIKPANIMLLERAGTLYVKVLDFGVAKILANSGREHTAAGTLLGSLHYMGPEQAKGAQIDHRTDIFALGSVLFEMLTLRRAWLRNSSGDPIMAGAPVKGGSEVENNDLALIMRLVNDPRPRPTRWRQGLPEEIDEVVAKALAVRPQDRYDTVEAFADDVDRVLSARAPSKRDAITKDLPVVVPPPIVARAPERTPTPTPVPLAHELVEPSRETGHTFETSRSEAFMEGTADLWSRVDEAFVREADEDAQSQIANEPSKRWPLALGALLTILVLGAAGFAVYRYDAKAPAPRVAPQPGRIIDAP